MHLAIDAVGVKHSGGAVVLLDVLRAAARSSAVGRITVFCSPRATRRFSFQRVPKLAEVECHAAENSVAGRLWWLTRGMAAHTEDCKADVLLCMSGIGTSNVPIIAFIQQSLPFCPDAMRRCGAMTRIRIGAIGGLMKRSCGRASLVVAQTQTMARWAERDFGIDRDRILVTEPWGDEAGMGSEQGGDIAPMRETPEGLRLLYVGNTSCYKNADRLAAAMAPIRAAAPGTKLFLTCPPDHPYCRAEGITGLGYLGGDTLKSAYRLATIYVTCSLVESGNLTLVEAMSEGTPIAAADRPYARDLCGDCAEYFDPMDHSSAASAIIGLLQDGGRRAEMAARGATRAAQGRAARPYDNLIARSAALVDSEAGVLLRGR